MDGRLDGWMTDRERESEVGDLRSEDRTAGWMDDGQRTGVGGRKAEEETTGWLDG